MFVRRLTPRDIKLEELRRFVALRALRMLEFRWTDVTQVRSMEPLGALTELRALDIRRSAVEDLRPAAGLPLVQLYCDASAVVDLSPLAGHPTLSHLSIENTKVTDLRPLLRCPKLCRVDMWGTSVSSSQVAELRAYVDEIANEPTMEKGVLMSGYSRGVSHG
jgi:hypothetical protein